MWPKTPQPLEDEAKVVTDGAEHGVGLVAVASLEEVSAEVAVVLEGVR